MGSAKLPILQVLRANPGIADGARKGNGDSGSEHFRAFCKNLVEEILTGKSVYFDTQVAYDIFYEKYVKKCMTDGKARYVENDLGIVKPPFNSMWFEFELNESTASYHLMGCCLGDISDDIAPGPNGEMVEEGVGVLALTFIMSNGVSLGFSPAWAAIEYNKETGQYLKTRLGDMDDPDTGVDDETMSMMSYLVVPVLTALSLINCRNVTTEETGRITFKRSGTEKRRGVPAKVIKYRTIILPGDGSASDGKGGHRATALHRVRGHFKTFTAEKPLLGKHIGTYWWGWQVRGTKEKGTVISDYKLKAGHNA